MRHERISCWITILCGVGGFILGIMNNQPATAVYALGMAMAALITRSVLGERDLYKQRWYWERDQNEELRIAHQDHIH